MNKLTTKTNSNNMYRKILNLAFATVGFAALASCSSDDNLGKKDSGGKGEQYLAVRVQSVSSTPSLRAEGQYQNGTENESKLGVVRFYLFDEDGQPFILRNTGNTQTGGVNYRDVDFSKPNEGTQSEIPGGSSTTVERQGSAVLIVDGETGGAPASIVAVVNPSSLRNASGAPVLSSGSMSLDELRSTDRTVTSTYDTETEDRPHSNFAMTNSVYVDGEKNEVFESSTVGKVKTSSADAGNDPVEIYVERIAAKVTVNKGTTVADATEVGQWTTISIDGQNRDACLVAKGIKFANNADANVYAVVQGWQLADEQPTAYIKKNITGNAAWTNDFLGFEPWSTADYHRSFWETRPSQPTVLNHSWNDCTRGFGDNNPLYTMPNTLPNTTATLKTLEQVNRRSSSTMPSVTKVLIGARLYYQNNEGNYVPAEICYDLVTGTNYIGESNLVNALLARNSNREGGIVKIIKTTNGEGEEATVSTDIKTLDASDIEYKATTVLDEAGQEVPVKDKDYEVKANIKTPTVAANQTVIFGRQTTTSLEESTITPLGTTLETSLKAANEIINTNKASIYKSGDTYYFTAIQHIGASNRPEGTSLTEWNAIERPIGWFGVVRNHWYQITINSLSGLGTAVYFPNEEIVPVVPENNSSYLSARINVLQWRIVSSSVDLDSEPKERPTTTPSTGE